MRIAIVEDERHFQRQFTSWITQLRPTWHTDIFPDSTFLSTQKLLYGKYDVILLDIVLGQADPTGGFRILRRVFEFFGDAAPTVIVVTGTPHPRDIDIMRALSVNEICSPKPGSAEELISTIDYVRAREKLPSVKHHDIELLPFKALRNCIRRGGGISLTGVEIAVFNVLLRSSPAVVSNEDLRSCLISGGPEAVQKVICEIRSKLPQLYSPEELEEKAIDDRLVTVPRAGYYWAT